MWEMFWESVLSDLRGDVALVVSGTRVGVSCKCVSEWPWNCVYGLFEDFNGVNFYYPRS